MDEIEQLEAFLEENEINLETLIYRTKDGSKIWEAEK